MKFLNVKNSVVLKPVLFCVLRKKKNNFFATVKKLDSRIIFNKSCGSLTGMRGSKKYTTVAVETLGKETFLKIFALGYKEFMAIVSLRFKIDKFARSFVRGFCLYGKKYMKFKLDCQLNKSHNGMRAKKKRRV